jgi:hypothetical protein
MSGGLGVEGVSIRTPVCIVLSLLAEICLLGCCCQVVALQLLWIGVISILLTS